MIANPEALPKIIQGGMGVSISDWRLAKTVASFGQEMGENVLGVVSGAALSTAIARRLQDGDPEDYLRRAFHAFPYSEMAERVWGKYFIGGGRTENQPYKLVPMVNYRPRQDVTELIICANFAEVWLAKQGHSGPIGINYLEKIQTPRLPELFGAMLAGVDFVLMGAGIPDQVPGVLDKLAAKQPVSYFIDLDGRRSTEYAMRFNPADYIPGNYIPKLRRPDFFAIISSNTLAEYLTNERKTSGRVDGFVIENHTAGGHNASPRGGKPMFNDRGELVYGPKDEVDLQRMRDLGIPFWLAGSYAGPDKLAEAFLAGAAGIQVGSIFALCDESGLREDIKRALIEQAFKDELDVKSDPRCSPSGFPFNVVQLPGTMSDPQIYKERERICDIGCLRQAYRNPKGEIAFRCPAEPKNIYVKSGGKIEDAAGRKCICNGLFAAAGLGQRRDKGLEPPIVTLGRDTSFIRNLVDKERKSFSARDALVYLLGK